MDEADPKKKYNFAVYSKGAVPPRMRQAIQRGFTGSPRHDPACTQICRGAIPGQFLRNALRVADRVVVGQVGDAVVAIISVLLPEFVSPVTGKAVCLLHEWYMDVVCSFYCHRAFGAETIRQFFQYARNQGVSAVRMYATKGSRTVWGDRWGFREAETRLRPDGVCVYRPVVRKSYPGETEADRTYRMTLIISPGKPSVPMQRRRRRPRYTAPKKRSRR